MYQFNSVPGGNYKHSQQSAPGGYNNGQGPPTQHTQVYPHLQNPPMQQQHYQVPPQTTQPPMPRYPGFPSDHQNQAPVFNGYGGNQQQAPTHEGSYLGNPPFTSPQPGACTSSPLATIPQQTAQYRSQAVMSNNPFPLAPQRQIPQGRVKSFPDRSSESCYNCGAPDHWAQDCPEPRRAVPAGQKNRPSKRQKTHGGTTTTNNQVLQQPLPDLQRSWTGPAAAQNFFPMPSNNPNVQATQANEQRPWAHKQFQRPRMSSTSSDGAASSAWSQQPHQGSFTSVSAHPSRQNAWIQQQNHQPGIQNVAGSNYQPWSSQPPNQPYPSVSPASASDAQAWNLQQPRLENGTMPMRRVSEQPAFISHNAQAEGKTSSQATQWPAQSLPTPAPSSIDSQIPSPATSSLNPIDQYVQTTPPHTESPRNRHDSGSSAYKKNQDPRTQQAEMVASLFSAAARTPASNSNSPENLVLVQESTEDIEDALEELYGLDFPDIVFEYNTTVSNPALPVAEPLSSKHELDENEQARTANTSLTVASLSKYIRDVQDEDFLKNVQESSDWDILKNDPVFAKIKANTATVTFIELIERRCHLVRVIAEAEEDDQEDDREDDREIDQHNQETEEARFTREQEERLAALGVTGTAKPLKASPTDVPFETPSPAETLLTRRVSGDPGWKHYENGRAVEHRSTSFESPSSATKDGQSVWSSQHHSPSDFAPERAGNVSPNTGGHEQQPYRKRTYSETSEEIEGIPRRRDTEPKQRKSRLKQPKVAAAYSRRW